MNYDRLWNLPSWFLPTVAMVVLLLLWEAVVDAFSIPLFVIPAPSDILHASIHSGGRIPFHTFITLYETIAGFAVATVIGIGLGIVIVSSRPKRQTAHPSEEYAGPIPTLD